MISPARSTVTFTQKDIKALFSKARRVLRQPGLDVLLAPKKFVSGHLLVVTPRKIGNAPERNKVRRRLKAVFYEEKLFETPYDCIVIVKPGGIKISFSQLREMLLSAYQKAQQVLHV
ncbi:MAG TPA: ribonuclease P protein component [Candidatus Dependentiae bacterium]|nr:ribonuclease P protein component [Candidatus Dependentiae bacterium]